MKREQVQKTKQYPRSEVDAPIEAVNSYPDSQGLESSLDDLLDEIDGVLEENAEEFVKGYIQKGGE